MAQIIMAIHQSNALWSIRERERERERDRKRKRERDREREKERERERGTIDFIDRY